MSSTEPERGAADRVAGNPNRTGPGAPDEVRAVICIVLGAVSLGYVAGLLSGHVQQAGPGADDNVFAPAGSWLGGRLSDQSVPRAAVAGVLTHLPGLFYITALNAITNSTSRIGNHITAFGLLGTYLIVKGVVELLP